MVLKVFEAFSGVGSQRMALRNLGVDYEVVATSEIDDFAVKSYAAIHDNNKVVPEETVENMEAYLKKRNIPLNKDGARKNLRGKRLKEFYEACVKSNNLGDISKVDTQDIPDHDLFTYSFPCQDISVAGKGLGLDEGGGTRSGLLWECQKVIAGKKPKYLLLENVKNLVGKKHKPNFDKWLEWLEGQGYTNYWEVLNAKDFGIPQNRERVFVVSILGEHKPYVFPSKEKLILRLKDILEDEVDEKYYLDDEKTEKLIATFTDVKDIEQQEGLKMNRNKVSRKTDVAQTLLARDYKGFGNQDMNGVIEPMIAASRGRNSNNPSDRTPGSPTEQRLEINRNGTSNTITTVQKDNYVIEPNNLKHTDYRIRKLTPKECWRLMGFSDDDFHKAEEVNSNTQLYKQAGNSIVVTVLEAIFKQLLETVN